MIKKAVLGALLATALMVPATGHAAQVIKKYRLTSTFGAGAPAAVRTIIFSLNFNNSADIDGTTNGLTIFSSDYALGTQFGYSAVGDLLTLANGTEAGPGSCTNPAGTFCSFIGGISGNSPDAFFTIEIDSNNTRHFATGRTIIELTGAVPEPATWAMLILGFGVVGAAMRSARHQAVRVTYT